MPKTTIKSWSTIFFTVLSCAVFAAAQEVGSEAESCNFRGIEETNAGRYQSAAAAFSRAIVLAPRFAKAHFNLGTVYYHLNELEKAVGEFEKAIENISQPVA